MLCFEVLVVMICAFGGFNFLTCWAWALSNCWVCGVFGLVFVDVFLDCYFEWVWWL